MGMTRSATSFLGYLKSSPGICFAPTQFSEDALLEDLQRGKDNYSMSSAEMMTFRTRLCSPNHFRKAKPELLSISKWEKKSQKLLTFLEPSLRAPRKTSFVTPKPDAPAWDRFTH